MTGSLFRRWLARWGPHGAVYRARDRLARTLAALGPERRLAFADVLPALDAILETELPRLAREAKFLQSWLDKLDPDDLKADLRRWERELAAAGEPALRAVRQRNRDLAEAQVTRWERLHSALCRYQDQVAGLALLIDECAGGIAAARLEECGDPEPELRRLRVEINQLNRELAELGATL